MGGGGGGGSTNISGPYGSGGGNRTPSHELPTINQFYGNQQDQYNQFVANNPLFNAANKGALNFFGQEPGLQAPLAALEQQAPGFFSGLQNEVSGIQGQVPGLQNQLSGIFSGLGGLIGQIPGLQNQLGGLSQQYQGLLSGLPSSNLLTDPLRGTLRDTTSDINKVFNPVVASGGALTGQQLRDATQQSRALAPSGSLQNSGQIASEVLNRDNAKDQRLGLYSGLMNNAAGTQGNLAGQIQNIIGADTGLRSSLLGAQAGLVGQQGNLLGLGGSLYGEQGQNTQQQSGLLGMLSALTGQKGSLFGQQVSDTSGLSSGQQTLQSNALNQLVGTAGAGISGFTGLTNPVLGYLGNLFSGNQQAQIAQAQINAQQNQAASAKGAGAASGAGSIISSVLPMIAMAFSDERTKRKIADSGLRTPQGVPISTWEYKTRPGIRFLGATAQDIEKKVPEAVFTDPRSGLKMIDTTQFPIVQISALKPTKKAA
jgi:hypothetical protein